MQSGLTTNSESASGSWVSSLGTMALLSTSLYAADPPKPPSLPQVYDNGAVAADHPLASRAGVEILKRGGNAIDAAVATSLALSVVRPASSGIGGGGFLVYWDAAKREATAWDYRERAPNRATPTMFVRENTSEQAEASQFGMLAVAVPGEVPGLCDILQTCGTLPLADVIAPALTLCEVGVPVDAHDQAAQREALADFARHPEYRQRFERLWSGYLKQGQPWKIGDRFYSPQKAALQALVREGRSAFTTGSVAKSLTSWSIAHGGLLEPADFSDLAPIRRQPLRLQTAGFEIVTMPPPSSGGIALIETLQILDAYGQTPGHQPWPKLPEADRMQVLIEALKHAFADRATYLGDSDFVQVPLKELTAPEHAIRLAARIDLMRTLPSSEYGKIAPPRDAGTTHFCVVDRWGNAVACTETINTGFGSFEVDETYGVILNNEMDDFTTVPGQKNAFGLLQSEANAIAPRKKPLSSMSPTIVLKDGEVVFVAGASGGPRIITSTLQVLLHMMHFEATATQAVRAPRLHHQWQPDHALLEPGFSHLQESLQSRGHLVKTASELAATQAIRRQGRQLEPASDPRKEGQASGY